MTNKVACGDVLDYVAGGTITSGQAVLTGDLLGVAVTSGVSGDTIALQIEGVFTLAKVASGSGKAWTQGQKLYWVAGSSSLDVTDNSGANKHVGYAFAAALTTDTTGQVRLLG